ncbi:MAG: HD domain-containing protein [Ignavibacteriaceae bacterium]|nr:HD domain-containing protein [Ignavibacteriaceae bacterium]
MNSIVKKVSDFVIEQFNSSLPKGITYHDLKHTKDVVKTSQLIAKNCKINQSQLEMLLIAAWFHDLGIIDHYTNHEKRSAEICKKFLTNLNYPANKIITISKIICSTKIPQKPTNLLEKILCDADISHMGEKKFIARSLLLRIEWENIINKKFSDLDWIKSNIEFIRHNNFQTKFAKNYYSEQRKKNLMNLKAKLKNYKITPPPKQRSAS